MPREITGTTTLCCLLGHPVQHSISPEMQNTAFDLLGLDYAYVAYDVTEDDLKTAIEAVRVFHIRGCNLTMPLKNAVLPLLDGLSDEARLSGSVNTIVNDGGNLIGHTTDGIGYLDALNDAGCDYKGKTMTVLGAGGAARSIIVSAALSGVKKLFVCKRKNETFDETVSFCKAIADASECDIIVCPMREDQEFHEVQDAVSESDILCNATNVGMGDDVRTPIRGVSFHPDLFVSDIIYHPEKTTLLKDAEAEGCRTMNGKYMLLYQGAASFWLWTGQEMPTDIIKKRCFDN